MDALEDDELPQASQACRVYWNPQADLLKQLAKTSLQSASAKSANSNKRTSKAAGLPSPSRPLRPSPESPSIFGDSDLSCSTLGTSIDTSTSFDGNSSTSSIRSRQSKRRKNGKTQSASLTMDPEALQRFSVLAAQLGHNKAKSIRPVASTSKLAQVSPPKGFAPGTRISPFSRSVSDSAAVLLAKPNQPEFERNRRSTTLPPADDLFSLPLEPPLEPILEPLSDPIVEPEPADAPMEEASVEETVIQESQPMLEDEWDAVDTSFDFVLSQVPAAELEAIMQPAPKSAPPPVQPKAVSTASPSIQPKVVSAAPVSKPKSISKPIPKITNPAKKPFAPSLSTNRPPISLPASSQSQFAVSARLSQTLKQGFKKPTFVRQPPPVTKVVQKKVVQQQEVEDLTLGIDFDADEGDLSF